MMYFAGLLFVCFTLLGIALSIILGWIDDIFKLSEKQWYRDFWGMDNFDEYSFPIEKNS